MSLLTPPLNANDFTGGTWSTINPDPGYTAPEAGFDESFGSWVDSTSNYGGWWWSGWNGYNYEGIFYEGSAVVVLDANNNNSYDGQDYILGYAYGQEDAGSSGSWDRNANDFTGTVEGSDFWDL